MKNLKSIYIFHSIILPLLLTVLAGTTARPVFSQEGIIASCYYEEKNTLKKMWKAREDGDKEKVEELSAQLQSFVAEKKAWAEKLLTVTEEAIKEVEAQNPSGLSPDEIDNIKEQIRGLEAEIRLNERIYEDCKLHYYRARQADALEIDNFKKIIEDIKSFAEKKAANLENDIKWNEEQIVCVKNFGLDTIKNRKNDIKWNEEQIVCIKNFGQDGIKNRQNDIKWNEEQIGAIKNFGLDGIKNRKNDIKWNEEQIVSIKNFGQDSIKNRQNDIKWNEEQIVNLKNFAKDTIRNRQNDIKWNKEQITPESNKEFIAERNNKIAGFEKEIAQIQEGVSTGNYSINAGSKSINDHKQRIKELNEEIAKISSGLGSGEYRINAGSRSINDHKQRIKELNDEIAKITSDIGSGEYSINNGSKSINDHKQRIKELNEEIAKITSDLGNGEYRINSGSRSINDHKNKIKELNDEIAKINSGLANGEFSVNSASSSIQDYKDKIEEIKNEIVQIKKTVADGTFSMNASSPTINDVKAKIEAVKDTAAKRRDEFTAEEWMNMKQTRKAIQAAELEIARLESMIGLKDEKLAKLHEDKRLLTKLLNHQFITKLPEEESGFIKAIKWCSNAIDEVNKAVSKYKKVKKVIDIIRSQDPLKAADTLLEAATGRGLVDTVADKLLPEKIYKNKYVQKFLNGEFKTAKDALQDFAQDQIPEDIRDKLETLKSLRENPEEFLKSRAYDKAMSVIEANPKLKNTLESFEKAKRYYENPELIEIELKQNIERYAGEKFENNEAVKSLKEKMKQYEERIEKIKQENLRRIENYQKNVAAHVVKHLKDTVENRIGLKDIENTSFAKELVEGYQFFNEPAGSN